MSGSRGNGKLITRLLSIAAAAVIMAVGPASDAWAQSTGEAGQSGGPVLLRPGTPLPEPDAAHRGVAPLDTEAGEPTSIVVPGNRGQDEQSLAVQTRATQEIEVNALEEIAPDSIGVLDPNTGGFGVEMWRGSDRGVIVSLLRRLPDDMNSRSMRELTRRLLLSIATPPETASNGQADAQVSLLVLRIERLASLGEVPGLNDLLSAVPSHNDDEFIARTRIDGLLLANEMTEACRLVANGIATYHQIFYWQKAMILCQMVAGEVDKATLGLDLLREQGLTDDPTFFALAQTFFGAEAEIPPQAEIGPLNFALLRATGAALPPSLSEPSSPGLLIAIAGAANIDPEARARAAEIACMKGMLDGSVLAEAYDRFSFSEEELANFVSATETLEGPRLRALLYQAAKSQTLPATRAEVLRVALEEAEKAGLYQAIVPVLLPLLSETEVSPELAWFAGPAGRAFYAAGRFEQASAWLALGRQEALINPQATTAMALLWPYSRLAGGAALTTEGNLENWRAMRESMGDRELNQRQMLLRAVFQALGVQDPLQWSVIAADGELVSRPLPNAALLYALEEASESQRIGETVLLSLVVLGERGPAESHTLALSAVLTALGRIGLEQEARNLAIEAALANGV
jgi:hypothetical protein